MFILMIIIFGLIIMLILSIMSFIVSIYIRNKNRRLSDWLLVLGVLGVIGTFWLAFGLVIFTLLSTDGQTGLMWFEVI